MIVCDKCKKELGKRDYKAHINLGVAFKYDVCKDCEEKFLLHADDFFDTKGDEK